MNREIMTLGKAVVLCAGELRKAWDSDTLPSGRVGSGRLTEMAVAEQSWERGGMRLCGVSGGGNSGAGTSAVGP